MEDPFLLIFLVLVLIYPVYKFLKSVRRFINNDNVLERKQILQGIIYWCVVILYMNGMISLILSKGLIFEQSFKTGTLINTQMYDFSFLNPPEYRIAVTYNFSEGNCTGLVTCHSLDGVAKVLSDSYKEKIIGVNKNECLFIDMLTCRFAENFRNISAILIVMFISKYVWIVINDFFQNYQYQDYQQIPENQI